MTTNKRQVFYAVTIRFDGSYKDYTYKSTFLCNYGDKVVVESPTTGLTVVTVTHCREWGGRIDPEAFKWLVSKVDTSHYNQLQEQDFKTRNRTLERENGDLRTALQQIASVLERNSRSLNT